MRYMVGNRSPKLLNIVRDRNVLSWSISRILDINDLLSMPTNFVSFYLVKLARSFLVWSINENTSDSRNIANEILRALR